MSTTKPKRAVHYLRVSSTRGRQDELISFDVQAKYCTELCAKRNWDVVEEIRDPDRKGSTLDRPGLNHARQLVADKQADVIVVWKLNRFARMGLKATLAVQGIVEAGGAVTSCDPQEQLMDTSTPLGLAIAHLFFAIAEEDLDRIRENWRNAAEHAVAEGWYMGGRSGRAFGYAKNGPRSRLTPDPVEAPIVVGLFQHAATGESYVRLRRYLFTNGVDMSVASIRHLLQNRVYLGEMHWGSSPGSARGSRPLVHEPIVNLHAHEPIIDEITWRRAQRNGQKFGLGREKQDPRLLSGLARCAGCRSTMIVNRMGDRSPYYTCRNASLRRENCAGSASVHAELIEAYVNDWMVDWLRREWRGKRFAQDDQGHERLRELDNQIATAEEHVRAFNHRQVQDMLTRVGENFLAGLTERYEHADRLRHERDALLDQMGIPDVFAKITEPEDWYTLDLDDKRLGLASTAGIVFVRQTSRRGPGASTREAVVERTRIVLRGDAEEIVLPRPGVKTDWAPFPFGDEPEAAAGVAKRKAR